MSKNGDPRKRRAAPGCLVQIKLLHVDPRGTLSNHFLTPNNDFANIPVDAVSATAGFEAMGSGFVHCRHDAYHLKYPWQAGVCARGADCQFVHLSAHNDVVQAYVAALNFHGTQLAQNERPPPRPVLEQADEGILGQVQREVGYGADTEWAQQGFNASAAHLAWFQNAMARSAMFKEKIHKEHPVRKLFSSLQLTYFADSFSARPVDLIRKLLDELVTPMQLALREMAAQGRLRNLATTQGEEDSKANCLVVTDGPGVAKQNEAKSYRFRLKNFDNGSYEEMGVNEAFCDFVARRAVAFNALEQLLSQLRRFIDDEPLQQLLWALTGVRNAFYHRTIFKFDRQTMTRWFQDVPKLVKQVIGGVARNVWLLRQKTLPERWTVCAEQGRKIGAALSRLEQYKSSMSDESIAEVSESVRVFTDAKAMAKKKKQNWLDQVQKQGGQPDLLSQCCTLVAIAAPRLLLKQFGSSASDDQLNLNAELLKKNKYYSTITRDKSTFDATDILMCVNQDLAWRILDIFAFAISHVLESDREACERTWKSAQHVPMIVRIGDADVTLSSHPQNDAFNPVACGLPDFMYMRGRCQAGKPVVNTNTLDTFIESRFEGDARSVLLGDPPGSGNGALDRISALRNALSHNQYRESMKMEQVSAALRSMQTVLDKLLTVQDLPQRDVVFVCNQLLHWIAKNETAYARFRTFAKFAEPGNTIMVSSADDSAGAVNRVSARAVFGVKKCVEKLTDHVYESCFPTLLDENCTANVPAEEPEERQGTEDAFAPIDVADDMWRPLRALVHELFHRSFIEFDDLDRE